MRVLLLILTFLYSASGFSGEVYDGVVTGIKIKDGFLALRIENGTVPNDSPRPSCADAKYSWAIPDSDNKYQAILSSALASKAGNIKVRVIGSGDCVDSSKELISQFNLVDGRL